MGFIKQLDTITANSIAAGEVVERPASVVKELCENAIDAGSTVISIDFEQGGIRSIQVTDNGSGMDSEDALVAFEAHATSKLRHITDLEDISSMGFRGEALPSIASVSQVTLKTRQVGYSVGTKVKISAGILEEHAPVGTSEGSSILVENLFFNVPARHKFLKRDATEGTRITEVVNRLILARPDISFMLRKDGKVLLHSPGNSDLASAIYTVFGREVSQQAIDVKQVDQANPVKVSGMIGRPGIARRSRASQIIFVNDRSVQSPLINRAIDEAYRSLLMKGEYAFAVLKIAIPQSLLDVNVHPQKLEVRFWNESQVFSAVLHAVRDTLFNNLEIKSENAPVADIVDTDQKTNETSPDPQLATFIEPGEQIELPLNKAIAEKAFTRPLLKAEEKATDVSEAIRAFREERQINVDQSRAAAYPDSPQYREEARLAEEVKESDTYQAETEATTAEVEANTDVKHPDLLPLSTAKISGVLFATYIILEHGDAYTLIDQHAAHEKILFERLLAESKSAKPAQSQILLAPEIIRLNQAEMEILESEQSFFESLGFHYDSFGEQQLALRSVPSGSVGQHAASSLRAAVDEIISHGSNLGLQSDRDDVYLAIATAACKAAIKAHDRISEPEIRALINDLLPLDNPYQCPHGRPVFIRSTRKDLEKRFRRIV